MKVKTLFLFFAILFLKTTTFSFQNKEHQIPYDSIYKKVSFYSKRNNHNKALFYSRKLLAKGLKDGNINQQAKSFSKIAEFQRKLNFKDSAFYYYNKSKHLYHQQKDSAQLGRILLNIAIIESDFGSYSASDSIAVESIKYLNGKRINTIASAYNCLAINSKKRFLYKDAISYYTKAINFSGKKSSKILYWSNLSVTYKDLKDYYKSISILENLLKDSIKIQKTKARIIDNLAHIKWLNNSKENILKDLLLAEEIRKNEKDNYGLIASYSHLSDYYKKINKNQSLFYAEKAYQISKNQKSVTGQLESIDKIVALQKPQKSIKYYQESIRLRDSLQKANTQRQYKFAKIKYNYEEEEKQKLKFKNLATENKLIAEQENSQKKNILILVILLTSVFIFYIHRRKQQHKKRILQENYKTETRIAKRLHDELGNGIYNVITKVLNPKFETEEVVNDLDKIYLQTRKISHENDAIETGAKFESYFKGLITSYNSYTCKIILKDVPILELNTLKEETQVELYRVFNELFVNMKKHSKASLVLISCKKIKKFNEIVYTDNGVGFANSTVVLKNGLKNMETRIKSIGGTLNFEQQPIKGCKITIRFKK
ncbi:hypothetical protein [uncultured Polaribacter sp.]|uniref:tetratricopeptide repeat-containing sensor histidine kinase n=1 Tax=uncultured Polaribacter sp. TaxID=174711 RepID=UPI00261E83D9|nr:hypothetical protein [uncultured Polaribacter sp.]